jgi:hypothetical protein
MLEPGVETHAAMSFQRNLELLSLLVKGNHDAVAAALQNGSSSQDDFIYFVEQHWLQLYVFALIEHSSARNWLQPKWFDQLKAYSIQQWVKQESLIRELFRLLTLLDTAGHEFILLKGPYLAERFFGGLERRTFGDLDILIRPNNLAAVESVLCGNGFVAKSSTLLSRRLTTYFTYSIDFLKPDVSLDLHWRFCAPLAHDLDYEAIWRQKQVFSLRRHNFWVLSDEYEILFHLIAIFKDLEMGIARLRSFVDLYLVLNRVSDQVEWEGFFARRRREKVFRISLSIMDLFFEVLDCREQFPRVAKIVAREKGCIKVIPLRRYRDLMEVVPGAAQNKLWASELYECSRVGLFLWWVVGWPFRIAVYHPEKYARLKRTMSLASVVRARTMRGAR